MRPIIWSSSETVRYSHVGDDETTARPSSDSEKVIHTSGQSRSILALWIFITLQSIVIVALLVSWYIFVNKRPSDLICAKQLAPYSPYLETSEVEYDEFTDQNGFLTDASPYRGHPSPELEERWTKLWRLPMIRFPDEKMEALNKTPAKDFVHVAPKYGEGVLGFLNVFHQLHCLNLVRQYTYRDSYDYSSATGFMRSEDFLRSHVDHCIEAIRRSLMCAADVTPLVFRPNATSEYGYDADFDMRRKCKNFERIQHWANENAANP